MPDRTVISPQTSHIGASPEASIESRAIESDETLTPDSVAVDWLAEMRVVYRAIWTLVDAGGVSPTCPALVAGADWTLD